MRTFSKDQKIKFQHIDKAGIVFYPRYMEMVNELVEDFFEEALDYSFAKMHDTHGIPTVDLQVKFLHPARLGDVVSKVLSPVKLGTSSLQCSFEFINKEKVLLLKGEVVLIYVKIGQEKTIASEAFPEEIRAKIEKYLN